MNQETQELIENNPMKLLLNKKKVTKKFTKKYLKGQFKIDKENKKTFDKLFNENKNKKSIDKFEELLIENGFKRRN